MPRKEQPSGQLTAEGQQSQVSEGIEAYELPKSVVTKIAKSALPDNAKLQKDTVLALVKGSTLFINYLAADIFNALEMIDFGYLAPLLEEQHQAWLAQSKSDKGKKSTTSSSANANGTSASASASTSRPSKQNGGAASLNKTTSASTAANGNPYPNINDKPSNPYPSISSGSGQGETGSPFTSKPLDLRGRGGDVQENADGEDEEVGDGEDAEGGGERGEGGPMDVDEVDR
ncbi:hypothetical protein NP233_g506 [Leucocoprinus birnbaumii]|uniref:DNA polymerase epsilon subunit D n=1 Tax=Leucocoprinus birnbaumii TaxID=56174 RepID=A0AAD5W280_9AGAR|nr:hypothetical protein NP233_g506 [Leucocoprinus birnbaumii]